MENEQQKEEPTNEENPASARDQTEDLDASSLVHTQSQSVLTKKKGRRVSFPLKDALVTGYLDPINPFALVQPVISTTELSNLYLASCEKHSTKPIDTIIKHLAALNLTTNSRTEVLSLSNQQLSHGSCEALEELFKRVQYKKIDLTSCDLDDISASSIFDMIEYYEATNDLIISENSNIKTRGWQACINMVKRSQALHSLSTRGTSLSDTNASHLGQALLCSNIYTLKLEHCGLSGRPMLSLCGALKGNGVLKELCIANNDLTCNDSFHISNVLKSNFYLQLLDISNNDIQDEGCRYIAEALIYQSNHINKANIPQPDTSTTSFDFDDLSMSLNNINNNKNRFSPTPKIEIEDLKEQETKAGVKDNNNSSSSAGASCRPPIASIENSSQLTGSSDSLKKLADSEVAAVSNKDSSYKMKYTTSSLSPISHLYDDNSGCCNSFLDRSPERSFSSESLCSETSNESNDSKSSIRLIEHKFSRNGTLERQVTMAQAAAAGGEHKLQTGLQVLILWNNSLTKMCSESFSELLASTNILEILNIGQNVLTNQFISDIRTSIRTNKSLSSLGLQSTHLACDGVKVLSEVIQFGGNSTLQRIDLRNNEIALFGLNSLNDALKCNKTIIRVDLDDTPKSIMIPMFETNSEYTRIVGAIRAQCSRNENPPELTDPPKAAAILDLQRVKSHFNSRKISLTCQSVKTPIGDTKVDPLLLDPHNKNAQNRRLRSPLPSPLPSPASSPLPSPSRSRFQVSRVSESKPQLTSSTGSSPSPSSSSSSPTFFPGNSGRFRVTAVDTAKIKNIAKPPIQTPLEANRLPRKEPLQRSKHLESKDSQQSFLNTSFSSVSMSQSLESPDFELKKFMDVDSSSSFSSSVDSIDRQNDMNISGESSFDLLDKESSSILGDSLEILSPDSLDGNKKEHFGSNENTLVSTSSSSSSNEGGTLTNSPSDLSPKQDKNRVRKTSWIQNLGKNEAYPATLSSLLNLFQHPTSLFTKTSPDSTLTSSGTSTPCTKPKTQSPPKDSIISKESSITGLIHWATNTLHHKKDDNPKVVACCSTNILQNISPENSVGRNCPTHLIMDNLPKSLQKELKENISPENTISTGSLSADELQEQGIQLLQIQQGQSIVEGKVVFQVGDTDDPTEDVEERAAEIEQEFLCSVTGQKDLGQITRDSLSILKHGSSSAEVDQEQ